VIDVKQPKTDVGYLPVEHAGMLRLKLRDARYGEHTGPSVTRDRQAGSASAPDPLWRGGADRV
jgi:hypothetical protein